MDPENLESIIKAHTPIICQAMINHQEFKYLETIYRRLSLAKVGRIDQVYNYAMDRFNDFHLHDKCNVYESKLWSMQDTIVEMYEEYMLYANKTNLTT